MIVDSYFIQFLITPVTGISNHRLGGFDLLFLCLVKSKNKPLDYDRL